MKCPLCNSNDTAFLCYYFYCFNENCWAVIDPRVIEIYLCKLNQGYIKLRKKTESGEE